MSNYIVWIIAASCVILLEILKIILNKYASSLYEKFKSWLPWVLLVVVYMIMLIVNKGLFLESLLTTLSIVADATLIYSLYESIKKFFIAKD